MTDLVLQQRLSPDAETPRTIQDAVAPRALVDQPVVRARIRKRVEGWQRSLNETRTSHASSRGNDGG